MAKEELPLLEESKERLEVYIRQLLYPKILRTRKMLLLKYGQVRAVMKPAYLPAIFSACTYAIVRRRAGKQPF
jgi:hypothetical protein